MNNEIGLWIDHKQALIFNGDGRELATVESNLERFRFTGGARGKTAYAANYFPAEDHEDRHYSEELNKYYDAVIALMRDASAIQIMGPGEARLELEKRLAHAGLKTKVAHVEAADKLTAPQIAARVRDFFSSHKVAA